MDVLKALGLWCQITFSNLFLLRTKLPVFGTEITVKITEYPVFYYDFVTHSCAGWMQVNRRSLS